MDRVLAAGATLWRRWAAIAPDLAGHVTAVGHDPDPGGFRPAGIDGLATKSA
ncbi:hypothetical protein [Streptomyces sp. NPDC000410]|uniref:hypothetical protein n=1 Tax=Streptomyces sp. NPDC000410 TaxID=3154254 RepID=UPI00331B6A9A